MQYNDSYHATIRDRARKRPVTSHGSKPDARLWGIACGREPLITVYQPFTVGLQTFAPAGMRLALSTDTIIDAEVKDTPNGQTRCTGRQLSLLRDR